MGCPHWKTVKLKVVSLEAGSADRTWLLESNSRPPAVPEQQQLLLQRIGQLKLDHRHPNGPARNGRLEMPVRSVIL